MARNLPINSTQMSRLARDAIKQLKKSLEALQSSPQTHDEILKGAAEALGLPLDVFRQRREQASERARTLRQQLATTLNARAQTAGCELTFKPPHLSFGCVTLHERAEHSWQVRVLDKHVAATVDTADGDVLADTALRIISSIEDTLDKIKVHAATLEHTISLVVPGEGGRTVSPNLLMLTMTSGSSLKTHLTSPVDTERVSLSRAQMAYLLKAMKTGHGLDAPQNISFHGASQRETAETHRHLFLPSHLEPRRNTEPAGPISAVSWGEART